MPSSVIFYFSVSPRVGNSFRLEHVWEFSLTLAKDHHEWLTLGRILDFTDLCRKNSAYVTQANVINAICTQGHCTRGRLHAIDNVDLHAYC